MMKRYFFTLGLLLSLVFTGCEYDDSCIWKELDKHAEQIAALQEWSKTVNTNISALQGLVSALENNDYVTGVAPVMEGGVEVGYTITFTKSAPVKIYHGRKGDKGDDGQDGKIPVIGIKKDTDGRYYWTLDGVWLTDGGSKIPTTGADGTNGVDGKSAYELAVAGGYTGTLAQWLESLKGADGQDGTNGVDGKSAYELAVAGGYTGTLAQWLGSLKGADGQDGRDAVAPQLRINTTSNFWEISTDGGSTWVSTGVAATGTQGVSGPQGPQGDAIFARNGVDYTSDPLSVTFTLADGTTKITLPKYQGLGITFADAPDYVLDITFDKATTFEYQTTGTIQGVGIASVLPAGWKVEIDEGAKTLTVTASGEFVDARALVVVTGQGGASASYWLTLNIASVPLASFEDDIFRSYCSQFDLDGDGVISRSEAMQVTMIIVSGSRSIASLREIGIFTELTELYCSNTFALSSLDLSKNTLLTYLDCSYSSLLSSLDLSKNTQLTYLDCYYNESLSSLDLTENTQLTYLDCSYNESLSSLDLTENTLLTYLNCSRTGLSSLDVSKNALLTKLYCYNNNELKTLDISTCTSLNTLNVRSNNILTDVWVWNGFDTHNFTECNPAQTNHIYKVKTP